MSRKRRPAARRAVLQALLGMMFLALLARSGSAQGSGYERTFVESKATVEKVLKEMQASIAGRLPVLDGFALAGDRPLDRYQRGYFQSTVQVTPTASGGSVVHVSTKVTAWYSDPIPSRSGYQLLNSNGRLEVDLLDEVAAELARRTAATPVPAANNAIPQGAPQLPPVSVSPLSPSPALPAPAASTSARPAPPAQTIAAVQPADSTPSAPTPRLPETGGTFSSSLAHGLAAERSGATETAHTLPPDVNDRELKAEADSLEEILKNQTRPKNLVAVKKSGTPVVASASLTAKTLFLASAHDEFEMLDYNADWVHVKISGLSRGWIWRTSLEMPNGIPEVGTPAGAAPAPTADELFRVSREETAPFPGDWEPLRNKNVKIISVQKTDESAASGDAKLKLEFAKSLLDKSYPELQKNANGLAGVVLIFDSADGGMIATTLATLQQWKAGTLSDSALWHQSYFDPPEMLGSSASQ
ncbi:MAG: hypothetical protein ACLPHP_05395 [Candidatus Sulfotelmatobacter sp.]